MALRGLFFVGIAIVSILAMGAFHYNYVVDVDYPYQVAVESHLWNAYYLPTPEAMKEEIGIAIQGMRDLGLTDDMYSYWFSWEKTPNRQMAFQYARLDEVINRIDAIILWRDTGLEGNVEQFQDVYQAKIDSVRAMLVQKGYMTVDDIAQSAYLLNYHTLFYFGEMISLPLVGMFVFGMLLGLGLLLMEPAYYGEDITFFTYLAVVLLVIFLIPVLLGITWANMAG